MRPLAQPALLLAAAALLGCGASHGLSVDVRTDLSPGGDFDRIEIRVGSLVLFDAARAIDYIEAPVRIGALAVPEGAVELHVSAMRGGSIVVRRTLRLMVRGATVVPVWLLRSCIDVVCPGAGASAAESACEAARCVRPECLGVESSAECPGPECAVDSECATPAASCARALCTEGRCLSVEIPGACRSSEYCDPGSGCTPIRGPALDAGQIDAGPPPLVDAGPPDTGARDSGLCWSGDGGVCGLGAVRVVAGDQHTCFLLADGRVACAGNSNSRALGVAPVGWVLSPVFVPVLAGVSALGSGFEHVCALRGELGLWCWGNGGRGQLGDGATDTRAAASPVLGLAVPVLEVDGGTTHTVVVLGDGTAAAWGDNRLGQLGDGTRADRAFPAPVLGATNVRSASAGHAHTCLVAGAGAVLCVGYNEWGQLGDDTLTLRTTLVPVVGLPGPARTVRASQHHSCALLEDGTVYCWGFGGDGRLGDGLGSTSRTAVLVAGLSDVVQIELGQAHGCAVTASRETWCWGNNGSGQLGDGTTATRRAPVLIALPPVIDLAAGWDHTCAILETGEPWCWGANSRFGDGTMANQLRPIPVLTPM